MYALSARPGRVSSWLSAFAQSETSSAPESDLVRASATIGMPTSLRTPVVRRARRCAANPRSSPLQRSSARPIAVTRGSCNARVHPTSGRRAPR